jgi:hypothetical protein
VKKTGFLLKQRDFVKGWRQRYFILEKKMLCYYKQQRDTLPRGAVMLEQVRRRFFLVKTRCWGCFLSGFRWAGLLCSFLR